MRILIVEDDVMIGESLLEDFKALLLALTP
jgi:hypothetical protein